MTVLIIIYYYVRKHIYRLLCGRGRSFLGAAEFLEIWSKVSVDEMCPVWVPTNLQNPIANKLPVVKIFGGEPGFFSVSHAHLFTGITTLNLEL